MGISLDKLDREFFLKPILEEALEKGEVVIDFTEEENGVARTRVLCKGLKNLRNKISSNKLNANYFKIASKVENLSIVNIGTKIIVKVKSSGALQASNIRRNRKLHRYLAQNKGS